MGALLKNALTPEGRQDIYIGDGGEHIDCTDLVAMKSFVDHYASFDKAITDAEEAKNIYRLFLAKAVRHGTTHVMVPTRFPKELLQASENLGIKAYPGKIITEEVPEEIKSPYFLYIDDVNKINPDIITAAAERARKSDSLLQIRVAFSREECIYCQRKTGLWPVDFLHYIGALNEHVQLVNTCWVTHMEIAKIADSKAQVVHLPRSNMLSGNGGTLPYPEMLAAGVKVLLGSDTKYLWESGSMLEEVKAASMLHSYQRWMPDVIPLNILFNATSVGSGFVVIDPDVPSHILEKDVLRSIVFSGGKILHVITENGFLIKDGMHT